MGKSSKKQEQVQELPPSPLGELIHAAVRRAIERRWRRSWRPR